MLQQKIDTSISFAVTAGLADKKNSAIPNFSRNSPQSFSGTKAASVFLTPIRANLPAIDSNDGSFLLEPGRVNLLNWNLDPTNSIWQKGSSVTIRPDSAVAPDGSNRADRVSWIFGENNSQLLKRDLKLRAGEDYYFSGILKLLSGQFNETDVLSFKGNGIVEEKTIFLGNVLNDYIGSYRWVEVGFRTKGQQPNMPTGRSLEEMTDIPPISVSANSVIFSNMEEFENGSLNGSRIGFAGINKTYEIISTTIASDGNMTLMTSSEDGDLITDGVTVETTADIGEPEEVDVSLEFYVESSISMDWGGVQLEESSFKTSMILQERGEIFPRSETEVFYHKKDNPLIGLKKYSLFLDIKEWNGDGNVFDAGNFKISIEGGKLRVVLNSIDMILNEPLPKKGLKILLQASDETFKFSVYINSKLVSKNDTSQFGTGESRITLTTEAVRLFHKIVIFNQTFTDGSIEVGEMAGGEVAELFLSEVISASMIATAIPEKILGAVTVPGPPEPVARGKISSISTVGLSVILEKNIHLFQTSGAVIFERKLADGSFRQIGFAQITGKSEASSTLTLDTVSSLQVGDFVASEYVPKPGTVSVRLPFKGIDRQEILEIDEPNSRVRISSSLSFIEKERAIVQSPEYQDVNEVIVESIDNTNGWLTLDRLDYLEVGDNILQIEEQLEIPAELYSVMLMQPDADIEFLTKARNGVVLANKNRDGKDKQAQLKIRVYL